MSKDELRRAIDKTKNDMVEAAKAMDFLTAAQLREHLPDVLQLAQQIKAEMQQEAVSAEINGTLYII